MDVGKTPVVKQDADSAYGTLLGTTLPESSAPSTTSSSLLTSSSSEASSDIDIDVEAQKEKEGFWFRWGGFLIGLACIATLVFFIILWGKAD